MFRKILKTEKRGTSKEPRAVIRFPAGFDRVAEDMVRLLLTPNATFRLGTSQMNERRTHFILTFLHDGMNRILTAEFVTFLKNIFFLFSDLYFFCVCTLSLLPTRQ